MQQQLSFAWFLLGWWTTTVHSFSPCHNVRPPLQRQRQQRHHHDLSAWPTRGTTPTRRCSGDHGIRSTRRHETYLNVAEAGDQSSSADAVDPETLRSVTFCNLPKDQGTIFALCTLLPYEPISFAHIARTDSLLLFGATHMNLL
jgi:hypothetical protein